MDYFNLEKVFLMGHSPGGYVTLAFLDLYSEHLSGFSLIQK